MKVIEKKSIQIKKKYSNLIFENNIFFDYQNFEQIIIAKTENHIFSYEKKLAYSCGLIKDDLEYETLKYSKVYINYINKKYPYLYFLKKVIKKKLYSNYISLLKNLNNDIKELIENKIIQTNKIYSINFGMGDLHSGLKSTSIIRFSNDEKLVYKPRKINTELFFDQFMKIIEQNLNINLNIKTPKYIIKDDYSWHKFVIYDCKQTNEKKYCENIGKLLGISYLLNSRDLIYDNLVLQNNDLYIVDMECIISPNIESRFNIRNEIDKEYDESVVSSGILPMGYGTLNKNESISAIFKVANDNNYHLPRINDDVLELNLSHIKLITESFEEFLKLIYTKKNTILTEIQKLANLNINLRLLFHTTDLYSTILDEMLIPEYLSEIDGFKELLNESFINESKTIRESIQNQLKLLDIPFFYSNSKGEIFDGLNNIVKKEKKYSFNYCLKDIILKINSLNYNKISFNKSLIEKTILVELDNQNKIEYKNQNFISINYNFNSDSKLNKSNLLKASEIIGEYLINHSILIKEKRNWITKTLKNDGSYTVKPLSSDLYDGNIGIDVFFYFLSKYSNNPKFSEISDELYSQNLTYFYDFIKLTKKNREEISLSLFNFPLSFLYSTIIRFESNFLDENKNIIINIFNLVDDLISKTIDVDYMQGVSSLLDKLLDLYAANKFCPEINNRLKSTILTIIDKIINSAYNFDGAIAWNFQMNISGVSIDNFLNGFSHGVSGIIFVLKKASIVLGLDFLNIYIKKAYEFEKMLFDEKNNSWLDNRLDQKTADIGAWCHGSGGVALSKLLFLNFEKSIDFENDLKIACKNILPSKYLNLSLCHGSMSNIEILNAADNYFKDNYYQDIINSFINQVSEQTIMGKLPKVSENGSINLTGMFIGLTGVGYQLLRFYDWENIPSIICLETDFYKYKTLH
jgi:lantibiotic modifying enzyme